MIRTEAFFKGHMPTMEKEHAAAVRHIKAFEKLAGKDREVRVRKDLLWMLHDGEMSEREFRILVGLYSQIEGRSPPVRVTYEDWAYRAAGYKGRKAYEAVHGAAAPAERASPTEPELAGIAAYVLDASSLPPVGDDRNSYPVGAGTPYYKGHARYDLAFWNAFLDRGEDVRSGDFVPILTRSGVRLRWHKHPETKPPVTAVTEAEAEHGLKAPYREGAWIVWHEMERGRPLLLIGRVTGFNVRRRVLLAEHQGQAVEVRLSGNPAPVAVVLDELAKLPAASDAAPAGPTFLPGPLYTQDQLRTTREKMERLRWWHSFSIGRRAYYSITRSSEQIATWVGEKAAHRDAVPLRKQDARQAYETARKNGVERLVPAVAERRRAAEAEAQRAVQEEAQRKAQEAQRLQVEAAAARQQEAQEAAARRQAAEAAARQQAAEAAARRQAAEAAARQQRTQMIANLHREMEQEKEEMAEAERRRREAEAERRRAEADARRQGRGVAEPDPAAKPQTPQNVPNIVPASSHL